MTDSNRAGQSVKTAITIEFAHATSSHNDAYVSRLRDIVNESYATAEEDIWKGDFQRTNTAEIEKFIRAGELLVAYVDAKEIQTSEPQVAVPSADANAAGLLVPIGCVQVRKISDSANSFAMLAVDKAYRGSGVGVDLVAFAEDYTRDVVGLPTMQVELLFPTTHQHAFKTRLQAWYGRRGYKLVKLGDFADEYPQFVPLLAGPAEYRIFEKSLR